MTTTTAFNANKLALSNIVDIIKLIGACQKKGVTHLKLEDLELDFTGTIIPRPPKLSKDEQEAFDLQRNFNQEQAELEVLRIEDPLLYEEKINQGLLEG